MTVLVSKPNRSLIVPRTGMTINLFPGAHKFADLGLDHLIVPHDPRTAILLKKIGCKVPNPMLAYYDWVGGKPFSVQKSTCAMLTTHQRAYVLNDMGTGKTRAALWAWDYLHGNGCAGKLLVVAPLSTLNFVWGREAFATLPHRKVAILHGSKKKRQERLRDQSVNVFVINHDGLKVISEELSLRTDIDTLVIDELAVYRNNSDRSKLMRKFAERFTWVWGMTGSPMPNEPPDVWAQCKIITPHTVPKYFKHCRDALMTRLNEFVWFPKPDAVEQAYAMMQPSVRYTMDDVMELPEVVSRTIDVELGPDQKRIYTKMMKEFHAMVDEKVITAANAGAAMNKLLQVSLGWVYDSNKATITLDGDLRVKALLELIDLCQRKVIVFVPYRHAIDGISKVFSERLPKDGKPIEHAVIHGDVNQSDRDSFFNLFQNTAKYKVLLCHPSCVAHGLTLTAADTTIWFGPIASLETYEQANARIRRVGQKHKQQFLHLQATPVEKKIYRLLLTKQKVQDSFLSLFKEATAIGAE